MGNLKIEHIVDSLLWILLAAFLYAYSFEFDKDIEIYQFGATAWPRAILLLIVIAAIGQLVHQWILSNRKTNDVGETFLAKEAIHENTSSEKRATAVSRHLSTFSLLLLPFVYMVLPGWIQRWFFNAETLHVIKLGCAGVLLFLYFAEMRNNRIGAMLALPIFLVPYYKT